MSIPAIKAEALLIHAVASDEWWEDVRVPMLETARKRLRALVKLLPKGQKKVVYSDFVDEVWRRHGRGPAEGHGRPEQWRSSRRRRERFSRGTSHTLRCSVCGETRL